MHGTVSHPVVHTRPPSVEHSPSSYLATSIVAPRAPTLTSFEETSSDFKFCDVHGTVSHPAVRTRPPSVEHSPSSYLATSVVAPKR